MAIPTVTSGSLAFRAITSTTAITGGEVTADGGAAVTARGLVWGTAVNPTVALTTKTLEGTGVGEFVSRMTGLTPNTTYYWRAYATNADGTAYGAETSFMSRLITLTNETNVAATVTTTIVPYSTLVPFYRSCTICQAYLESSDELAPLAPITGKCSSEQYPVAGFGAMYRLIADGLSAPTFNSLFKKSSASGDWVATANTLNLIAFLFDGVDYWYSITQPA